MINLPKYNITSEAAGLGSFNVITASYTFAAATMASAASKYVIFDVGALENTSAITTIQATVTTAIASYSGTYLVIGLLTVGPQIPFASRPLNITIAPYYQGGHLYAILVVHNNNFSSYSHPSITISLKARTYKAPF